MTDPLEHRPIGPLRRGGGEYNDVWRAERKLACPYCGSGIDAHAAADGSGDRPENGDYTVCYICASASRYVVGPLGFALRGLTEDEQIEFDARHRGVRDRILANWARKGGAPPPRPLD